jgi:Cu+-exporting ATPase
MAKDTVCGMTVDEKSAKSMTHNGEKYYFCSDSCLSSFKADSKRFAK